MAGRVDMGARVNTELHLGGVVEGAVLHAAGQPEEPTEPGGMSGLYLWVISNIRPFPNTSLRSGTKPPPSSEPQPASTPEGQAMLADEAAVIASTVAQSSARR